MFHSAGLSSRVLLSAVSNGYGPFSSTVKPSCTSVVKNVHLQPNQNLRAALSALEHPSSLEHIPFQSAQWKQCVVHLYRTLLRLHNKPIAVSLSTSLSKGPRDAVTAITGPPTACDSSAAPSASDPALEDCLVRFLLSEEQRELGNRFVKIQFETHMDADSVTAANFYASWYDYVLQLASGVTQRDLTPEEKRWLTDEQKSKLEDLRQGVVSLRRAQDKPNELI